MSATDDTAARRPRKTDSESGRDNRRRDAQGGGKPPSGDLSSALKTAYDKTLKEEVPKDFLDLLGKLS